MQYIFEKSTETPSRGALGCLSNIPDIKERYPVQFNGDDMWLNEI